MKNRPLLIFALASVVVPARLYVSVGGVQGIARNPFMALGVTGLMAVILIALFWLRYRRMRREPIYVEVENRADGEALDARLDHTPIVFVASRSKVALPILVMLPLLLLVGFLIWPQRGLCRVLGIADLLPIFAIGLVRAVFALIQPQQIEITPNGMKHTTFQGARSWRWDEMRNVTLIKGRVYGLSWTSGVAFNVFAASESDPRPSRHILLPHWPIPLDELATLLNDARTRWSSNTAVALVPVRRKLIEWVIAPLVLLSVGFLFWLIYAQPCGP